MLDFLLTHVHRDGDCRLWAGAVHADGYPVVSWHRKTRLCRRLLLELLGRHPRSRVWTTCGQQLCLAPDHLRSGSPAQMLAHSRREGRLHGGPQHSLAVSMGRARTAKLPVSEARSVFAARARGETLEVIARRYGVVRSAVGTAIRKWTAMGVTL
jgi:hypothetical protein